MDVEKVFLYRRRHGLMMLDGGSNLLVGWAASCRICKAPLEPKVLSTARNIKHQRFGEQV